MSFEMKNSESKPQRPLFYGWWIVVAASIMGIFGNGSISNGFPRFFEPIRSDLDISYVRMSLIFSLARAEVGIDGPLMGWLVDRYGARPMVFIGGLLAGFGLMLLSAANSYWYFVFLFVGAISIGKTAAFGQTLMAVVNQWFIRGKAMALSTLMASFAGGGALMVLLLDIGISNIGWRSTLFYTGLLIVVLTIPVSLVIYSKPEDMGLRPDGDESSSSGSDIDQEEVPYEQDPIEGNFSVQQALRTKAFWLILIGVITRVSATNAIMVHIFPILQLKGMDERTASTCVAAMYLLAIPLRFLLGIAAGKFSSRKILFSGMFMGAIGIMAVWGIPGMVGVVMFIVGLSIVEGITSVNWLMVGEYFGRLRYATLMGIMIFFNSLGMFIAPLFAGFVRDHTDNYDLVLLTFAPILVLSAISFAMAAKPMRPKLFIDNHDKTPF